MERSRRKGTKRAPHAKFAELRELKESGKKRSATYKVEEGEDLYEEVDEESYKKVVRDRLAEDDFVVDDQGEGYADNGTEDWGDGNREGSWDESDGGDKKGGQKSIKARKAEEEKRRGEQEGNIRKYFSGANIVPTVKPKVGEVHAVQSEGHH